MAGSVLGRVLVLTPTNKSGGALAKGDVVVIDTANDYAVTTTTTGATTVPLGVVIEENGIANNAAGRVQFEGYVALVNVPASVTRGHYLQTHTVAKQAVGNSSRQAGSAGIFTTGGTTPSAYLFGITDGATGSGGIPLSLVDAAGDLIQGSAADTAVRLAASATAGAHLVSQGAATALAWFFGSPQWAQAPASDLNTTSGSPVEISSSLRITATVGVSGVAIAMGSAILRMGAVTADVILRVDAAAGTKFIAGAAGWDGVADRKTVAISYIFTGLTPGSTEFRLYWETTGGNTVFQDGAARGAAEHGTRWIILPL